MIEIAISHGEYIDRLTILVNKVYNCNNQTDLVHAVKALIELSQGVLVGEHLEEQDADVAIELIGLRNVNKGLWELEKQVREDGLDDTTRLKISDDIRVLNAQRAALKRTVDSKTAEPFLEVKDYDLGNM